MLFDALYASGFLIRKPTSDAEERVRRLVRRLRLPARDMASWLGILHQIVWKLKTPAGKPR
jgi:tRNA C32,U32 (ribose-2'-O)-methylase TrmJ